jgi:hypothetical protein
MSTAANAYRAPYTVAPYDTQLCVSSADFKTTAAVSYSRCTTHDMVAVNYTAAHQRNQNQNLNYKIDPPFQIHLNEREIKQRDKIKTMFAIKKRGSKKTGTGAVKPKSKVARKKKPEDGEFEFERKPPVPRQAHRAL